MAVPVVHHAVTCPPPVATQNSRNSQLTARIPAEDDHDNDTTSDEDEDVETSGDADSMIGISISRAQTNLKLPTTPAATKAQAMQASSSYFEAEPDDHHILYDEPLQQESSSSEHEVPLIHGQQKSQTVPVPQPIPQPSSPSRAQIVADTPTRSDKRSSIVSSILGSVSGNARPRSSSGSSIVGTVKKRLLTLPSINLPKVTGSSDAEKTFTKPQAVDTINTPKSSQPLRGQQSENVDVRGPPAHKTTMQQVDGSNEKVAPSQTPRRRVVRRATSDQSLYLRKSATGSSTFDDYTVYANVSEMVNSRFKAITDSFQDSSFRKPKLLSTNQADRRQKPTRTNSEETREYTKINTGAMLPTESDDNTTSAPRPQGTSKHPRLKEALSRLTGDLVIMGGYRGSILRDAETRRQLWVPIKVGMNLRKADLEVGLTREDELEMHQKIVPDGALSHIGPVDICRRLLKKCKNCLNVQNGQLRVHDYGYDWRLSPDLLADRLIEFLERLACNQSDTPIHERGAWLISHSLGGLLTRHVTNRRPELIAGILYAGTPQNCVNILGPLRNGDDVLFSSRVLTAQVNFTLRTSFALLPQNGRCFINKSTGERYDVDFFDPKSWDEYRLSPCIRQPLVYQRQEKRTSLLGSISDAMTQSTKHIPWFSSGSGSRDAGQQVKDTAEDVAEDLEGAAEAIKLERPLSLTMNDSSSRHHKPSVATTSTIPSIAATEYLERTLASVLKFKQDLAHRSSLQARNMYPPAAVLFAKSTPTVYGAFVNSREAIKYDNAFDELAFAAGDGVVLASAAQLPSGYKCVGRVESDRGHVGLLGDLEGVGKCLLALIDARSRGVGRGAYTNQLDKALDDDVSMSRDPNAAAKRSQ